MQRFFINETNIKDNKIFLEGESYNHIVKVLRMKIDDIIYLSYNKLDYISKIIEIEKNYVNLEVLEIKENDTEPKTYIHLFQGLPKQDKLEYIIQKSVELGVSEITPVETKFCIAKINKKSSDKADRLLKISESASYQCGRGIIPKVNSPINFKELSKFNFKDSINIVAYEKEEIKTLKSLLTAKNIENKKINVFIGSEGGIATEEIETLTSLGFVPITLGKRILRTETAPLNILSNIIYELEM
ncbi:MAG: RsmE family RNA methyltransferase [Lachnospirales bacterium]